MRAFINAMFYCAAATNENTRGYLMRPIIDVLFYCAVITVVTLIAGAAIPARAASGDYTAIQYDNCGPGGDLRAYSNVNELWPGVEFFPYHFDGDICRSYSTAENCGLLAQQTDCEFKKGLCSEWRKYAAGLDKKDRKRIDLTIRQNCRGL
jgi:hypothetical protein